ncbi:MAG: hypothetical protein ACO3P9_07735, partial [Phycisphaerales bacterium]
PRDRQAPHPPVAVGGADGAPETAMNFTRLFSVPMWMAVACLAALLVFYPGRRSTPSPAA